ncbi:hypothetical protein [Geothrix sp. 21YS21S-2]|uniref:hypothetical protein n=1 Tax=Geothrix sp. 21YS21S-2 TaxID=3068893 RepID=UPI0027B92120|nr:hypothetical protein [Geothrix sp. 21YS21S-2]
MRAEEARELALRVLARIRALAVPAGSRLWNRIRGFLDEVGQGLAAHRFRSTVALLILATALLAGARALPVVYGHYALRHAAGIAARQSRIKGEEGARASLRRRAFDLGLTEAALDADSFKLETGLTEEGPVCTVSYDFTHQVDVYGVFTLPVRFRGKVTGIQVDPLPNPLAVDGDEKEPRR